MFPAYCPSLACLILLMGSMTAQPVAAQLYSDFRSIDDSEVASNVYFGSAKDTKGNYVRGATVIVATPLMDFVAVSDRHGRFRLTLPVDVRPSDVEARCSHSTYARARVVRRLPRGEALTPVELSCRLM